MMKRTDFLWSLPAVATLSGCSSVPLTGRPQLKAIPPSMLLSQSAVAYGEVKSKGPLSTNAKQIAQIKRVGQRIGSAVEHHMRSIDQEELLEGFAWEFNLIEDATPNAWCMPGGKIMFYSGILSYTKNDAGVAVVMAHEIAHAVAGHANERATHQLIQQGGSMLTSYLAKDTKYREAIMQTYGLGAKYLAILPYSRVHEYEADELGIIFMAMAGYDPRASIAFWKRMDAAAKKKPLAFFSTHPSDAARIKKLYEVMPEALKYYKG